MANCLKVFAPSRTIRNPVHLTPSRFTTMSTNEEMAGLAQPSSPQGEGKPVSVWLVLRGYDYEGDDAIACFDSESQAKAFKEAIEECPGKKNGGKEFSYDSVTIQKWGVNEIDANTLSRLQANGAWPTSTGSEGSAMPSEQPDEMAGVRTEQHPPAHPSGETTGTHADTKQEDGK